MNDTAGAVSRRDFIRTGGALGAGAVFAASPLGFALAGGRKTRVALVGTGIRGVKFWGRFIQDNYADAVEFAGLCDVNPGRLAFGRSWIGVPDCPTFTDFDEMLAVAKPDLVMVATVDSTHDEFIVKALAAGIDVVTEKPMTTTADKCRNIVDAARASSARPFAAAPIYPVISMSAPVAHMGSRERLIGAGASQAEEWAHSPQRQVPADAPPCFLVHAEDDPSVPVENSLEFRAALRARGIAVETHLFAEGGHGFGLRNAAGKPAAVWPELFHAWSRSIGLAHT